MAYVFYVLGWLGILAGGGLVALALQAGRNIDTTGPYAGAASLGVFMAAAPGFSIMFGGLLVLAIGGGLARLDGILRYTRQVARGTRDLNENLRVEPK